MWRASRGCLARCTSGSRRRRSHPGGGQLRALGTRREASSDDNFGPGGRTRPLPVSRRFRIVFWIAKIILAVVVTFAVAIGLIFVLTPSAGQATALAQGQAREHHIAYPGPPVPVYFAHALVATEDHRFYTDPGVDPLALARVVVSWVTGHPDQGGSTIDQQLAKNLYTGGHSGFTQDPGATGHGRQAQPDVQQAGDTPHVRGDRVLRPWLLRPGGCQLRLFRPAAGSADPGTGGHAGRRGKRAHLR